MLSLISDISVFKLFTPQYYFLRHIYTVCIIRMVMPFIRLQVQKLITIRVAGTMPLFACIRSCMAFYFTLPMFQVGKLGQKSGCLGQYQLSWYNIKYIKISICNIVYRCILAMPLRFECCCESYVRLHNLTVVVCSHTSGLRSWGSRWSYIWAISLNLLMGTSV